MIKRSCENDSVVYVCLPFGYRLVFDNKKYVGWYKA